ncbi:MAG TPA: Uma2 family endonuclease [Crinalium sp.]|jgi:Uma2 family endonuclease
MADTTLPAPLIELPPTQADLPYDDDEPMESARHTAQMDLLTDALIPWLAQRDDGFVGGNMFVYYSLAQVRNKDFKGPDVFVVLGVPKGERKSWVVWEEGKAPDVVIELLSDSTAAADKNAKKLIYQNQMRVPEYFWYDPFNPEDWTGFSIQQRVYQPLVENDRHQLVSGSLGLALQRWQGQYKGIEATWLRWATLEGDILLTPEEQERQRADRAESLLLQTAQNLLANGMTVEQVGTITGLDAAAIAALTANASPDQD